MQRILRPQKPRTENLRLMTTDASCRIRLLVEDTRDGHRAKYLIYRYIIADAITASWRMQSTSDCVVGADGLEPPTLSV